MKIVYCNIWEGKLEQALVGFLQSHAPDTDIFCFQEAYDGARKLVRPHLQDFDETYKYALAFKEGDIVEDFAQATYIKKSIKTIGTDYLLDDTKPRGLGIVSTIDIRGSELRVLNYHGVSRPKDKLDTPERIHQSQAIVDYFKSFSGPKIIGGDFNFLPNIDSYNVIRDNGYNELIIGNNITTTRNHLYWDRANNAYKHMFSDYVFVSSNISISKFTVPAIEISDHLPVILEFEVL